MATLEISTEAAIKLAEKNGLFDDFDCGYCERPNDLKPIINDPNAETSDFILGLRYDCAHCGTSDLCSFEIIEEAASEYLDDLDLSKI